MCGILGIAYKKSGLDTALFNEAFSLISHRGPDDFGISDDGSVCLAHKRLSILDLSSFAKQPMSSEAGNLISFNGEIYNYLDLKKDLQDRGYQFQSTGDTEVILKGYEAYGKELFSKMRGMWAIAIYDKKQKQIVLSRDCFGIKPLYYSLARENFYFGSEVKSLIKLVSKVTPNRDFYHQFFNLGYFIHPQTAFREILKVQPGETLIWDIEGAKLKREYFEPFTGLNFTKTAGTFADSVRVVEEALTQSVESHFISDVPVGLLLSGGVDSSLLAALSIKIGKRPVAFNLNILNSSDAYYAGEIKKALGLEMISAEMGESALEDQYEKIWSTLDEPISDYSIIPTSLIYSHIAGKAKVVLSGEGGDELFGGYIRHLKLANKKTFHRSSLPFAIADFIQGGSSNLSLKYINPVVSRLRNYWTDNFADDLIGSFLAYSRSADFPFDSAKMRNDLCNFVESQHFAEAKKPASLFLDRFLALPNDLMYKTDMASMMYSVEGRVPFLDVGLYREVLAKVPDRYCLSKEFSGKRILKTILEKYLDPGLVNRPKKGFGFSFDRYQFKSFRADLEKALKFHKDCAEAFGLNGSRFLNLISPKNAQILTKKFPALAFSLVSNWRIFKNLV